MKKSTLHRTLLAGCIALGVSAAAQANDQPGKGVSVQPLQSSIAEETFQTLLVGRALQKLGYTVQAIKEVEYPTAHVALANGDATFMADHWNPLHADYYKNAGGDGKLYRKGVYSGNAAQGYLIDKKTADQYKITHLDQLKDPALAVQLGLTSGILEIVGVQRVPVVGQEGGVAIAHGNMGRGVFHLLDGLYVVAQLLQRFHHQQGLEGFLSNRAFQRQHFHALAG